MGPGTLVGRKYRLTGFLGEGAMGAVWAAVNVATDRPVALKLVSDSAAKNPDVVARLRQEAKACGRIDHPNVVQVYDAGESESGEPYLVMQLLSGETLDDRLAREGRLSSAEAARIGAQIARALSAAHALRVVHRDLKPANVFLQRDAAGGPPIVKVLDFGVSKIVRDAAGGDALVTATGMAVGSPAYMSPEQATNAARVDARSDLWALGVVLYELAAGNLPFEGETVYAVAGAILSGPIPDLAVAAPDVDPRLASLVARCLVRDIDSRLASAEEAANTLDAIARDPTVGLPSAVSAEDDDDAKTQLYGQRAPAAPQRAPATTTQRAPAVEARANAVTIPATNTVAGSVAHAGRILETGGGSAVTIPAPYNLVNNAPPFLAAPPRTDAPRSRSKWLLPASAFALLTAALATAAVLALRGRTETASGSAPDAPSSTAVSPGTMDIAPGADTPSASTGVAPTNAGVAPTNAGVVPASTGVAPTNAGVVPAGTGVTPTSTGVMTASPAGPVSSSAAGRTTPPRPTATAHPKASASPTIVAEPLPTGKY